jgi:hypothetical protein
MQYSKLAGIVVAACGLAASHDSSAATTSMHPFNCKLVGTSSPYNEVPASHGGGLFTNNSGGYRWAMCPVPWNADTYNFRIYGSSTSMTCYLQTVSTGGSVSLFSPDSQSGNYKQWYRPWTSGTYAAELQCYLPNGHSIWHTVNY